MQSPRLAKRLQLHGFAFAFALNEMLSLFVVRIVIFVFKIENHVKSETKEILLTKTETTDCG